MYIPESMEVIEQGVNDMMKETDFETFIDGIMAAIVLLLCGWMSIFSFLPFIF